MVGNSHSSEYKPLPRTRKSATVTVRSVDHDKCVWPAQEIITKNLSETDKTWIKDRYIQLVDHYLKNKTLNTYLNINSSLAETLNSLFSAHFQHFIANPNSSKLIFISGSNRQCRSMDRGNSRRPGQKDSASSIHTIENLTTHYNLNNTANPASINRLLLADVLTPQPIGTTFDAIKHEVNNQFGAYGDEYTPPTPSDKKIDLLCEIDPYKFTSLYAQMHAVASQEAPNAVIDVEFIDDNTDLLTSLETFYKTHKEFIPHNVRLCLRHYDMTSESTQTFKTVTLEGTGPINAQWQQTVRYVIETNATTENLPNSEATPKDKAKHATSLFAPHLSLFTEIAAITRRSSQKTIAALAQKIIEHAENHPGFLKHAFPSETDSHRLVLQNAVFEALDKRLKHYDTLTASHQATIQKLDHLKDTVEARNARGAWRSGLFSKEAWGKWYVHRSDYSFKGWSDWGKRWSSQGWSDWWNGKHNKSNPDNNQAYVGLWFWGTRQLNCSFERTLAKTNDSAVAKKETVSFRYSAQFPFWGWPTKQQVKDNIETAKKSANSAISQNNDYATYLRQQRDDFTTHLTQRFTEKAKADATPGQNYDLAGNSYYLHGEAAQTSMSLAKNSCTNIFEGNNTRNCNGFTEWLTGGDPKALNVAKRFGVENTWAKPIADQLGALQCTLDQQLTLALRTLEASLRSTEALAEPDLKHIFAIARVQLINDVRTQVQKAFSQCHRDQEHCLDAKGFERLQTKLDKIHQQIPKMALPVVAAKVLETPASKVFDKGSVSRAALKERARPLYDALKAAERKPSKIIAPTASMSEAQQSVGKPFSCLNPLTWFNSGKEYRVTPQAEQ